MLRLNIPNMNKSQAYETAKDLAANLGEDVSGRWVGSTTQYWRNKVTYYRLEIEKRNRLYNTAVELAADLRQELPRANPDGTNRKFWRNTLKQFPIIFMI